MSPQRASWAIRPPIIVSTTGPGQEGVGPGFVHNGRNEGSISLVMEVVYINPVGAPKSVEVAGPAECEVS